MLAPLLKKLRAVHAVSNSGSTASAARELHLSQPAVARAIQAVEAALGEPIFTRSAQGMVPTTLGAMLAARAGRALNHLARVDLPTVDADQAAAHPLGDYVATAGAITETRWLASRLASGANDRHLQALLSLAQARDEPLAAQSLGVSVSALRQTLAQLEHLAGRPLLYRGRGAPRLTEPGELTLRCVKLALAELAQAEQDMTAHEGALRGHIVIGTLPFSTDLFLPQAIQVVLGLHPGLRITVIDGTFETLLHQLRHAEIDVVVGALRSPAPPEVMQHRLFEDPLAVVARPGHPLALAPPRDLRALRHADWLLPMPGSPAQAAFDQAFARQRTAPPAASLRVNSPMLIQALLAESDRVALMSSRQAAREALAGRLCVLPVAVPHAPRHIGYITRAGYLPAPGARLLLQAFEAQGRALGPPGRRKQNA